MKQALLSFHIQMMAHQSPEYLVDMIDVQTKMVNTQECHLCM